MVDLVPHAHKAVPARCVDLGPGDGEADSSRPVQGTWEAADRVAQEAAPDDSGGQLPSVNVAGAAYNLSATIGSALKFAYAQSCPAQLR